MQDANESLTAEQLVAESRALRAPAQGRVTRSVHPPGMHRVLVTDGAVTLHEQEVRVPAGLNPEVVVRLTQ